MHRVFRVFAISFVEIVFLLLESGWHFGLIAADFQFVITTLLDPRICGRIYWDFNYMLEFMGILFANEWY